MGKSKLITDVQMKEIVNFMLREYDVDYDYVFKHQRINGIDWFEYYWDDKNSKQVFLNWLSIYIKENINCKRVTVIDLVNHFDFIFGLKVY